MIIPDLFYGKTAILSLFYHFFFFFFDVQFSLPFQRMITE